MHVRRLELVAQNLSCSACSFRTFQLKRYVTLKNTRSFSCHISKRHKTYVKFQAVDNVEDRNMDGRRDDCMIVNNEEFVSGDEITADFDGQNDNHSNCEEEKEKRCELLLIMKILHFLLALQS
ncbi:unnamed protein product [Didymodactylos carnosus]|uniref:Uncharacterized protein n=1 Tax=Didymodactylos carnosus TaxID=1234261 RepID=A0A815GVI5_9BILA|nr:unnamed protein product [Didymodactylos carnosus]CAF4210774.1 unnamed protein product [Didymodactylos carnosus]